MSKTTICLDFGNTGIKYLDGSPSQKKVNYKLIESQYLVLPHSSSTHLPKDPGMGRSVDSAWVKFKKKDDCHLIGFTAKDYQARLNLSTKKVNSIIPKTLGVLGSRYEEEAFEEYTLGLLVPLNELGGASELISNLVKALKSFYFRERKMSLPISKEDIWVVPEGTGAAMRDRQSLKKDVRAYVMIGYNHATINIFKHGRFVESLSRIERLGAVRLIEFMQRQFPGLERDALNCAIFTTIDTLKKGKACPDWRKIDCNIGKLEQVYAHARQEYWLLLKNWFDGCLPTSGVNTVVRLGGTSDLLSDFLDPYFRKDLGFNYYVPNDYRDTMLAALGFDSLHSTAALDFIRLNPIRFADVWGLFVALSGYQYDRVTNNQSLAVGSILTHPR